MVGSKKKCVASQGKLSISQKVDATQKINFAHENEKTYDNSVNHALAISSSMKQFYPGGTFSDVTLSAGGRKFQAHKLILAATSDYFRSLFSAPDFNEKYGITVDINDIGADTMALLIVYMYCGKITLTKENVKDILIAADRFVLAALKRRCEEFITVNDMYIASVIDYHMFALDYSCKYLSEKTKEMICHEFETICKVEAFLNLPKDIIVSILSDDGINVATEEIVFEAGMAWLQFDLTSRQPYLLDIMKCVRFALLSPRYFYEYIDNSYMIQSSSEMQDLLESVRPCDDADSNVVPHL